jgi:hypothetical protein
LVYTLSQKWIDQTRSVFHEKNVPLSDNLGRMVERQESPYAVLHRNPIRIAENLICPPHLLLLILDSHPKRIAAAIYFKTPPVSPGQRIQVDMQPIRWIYWDIWHGGLAETITTPALFLRIEILSHAAIGPIGPD